jgi:hypothetical protein
MPPDLGIAQTLGRMRHRLYLRLLLVPEQP